MTALPRWLAGVAAVLLLGGCSGTKGPVAGQQRMAVAPVAFATWQPAEQCSLFIDEELRSALVRQLRSQGYGGAESVGPSVPRSFAKGSPPPEPGSPPQANLLSFATRDGLLAVWIDEYWENTLCGWEGPKYLTMGATAVLYAGSPPAERWRGQARVADQGSYSSRDLIWLVTSRLAEQLLAPLSSR